LSRARLDLELVRRRLVASRSEAKRAIEAGRVLVRGLPAASAATQVDPGTPIGLAADAPRFVSRGGEKLDHALIRLDVEVAGRRWLDAGASTGGFTDRLLQGGAAAVVAIDVGYGQLDWRLRGDDRVTVIERFNVRSLRPSDLPWAPDGVVADLSFISLALVLPALAAVAGDQADLLLLVKPQFEAGRQAVGRNGVVRDPAEWAAAMRRVAEAGRGLGFGLAAAVPSEPPGPAGNREFFVLLPRSATTDEAAIDRAVAEVAG
jgi:23S rRNA (cytidine1920-2'-O)/16S rRNA (cytidine1409-2'-O)-methyltransferase